MKDNFKLTIKYSISKNKQMIKQNRKQKAKVIKWSRKLKMLKKKKKNKNNIKCNLINFKII